MLRKLGLFREPLPILGHYLRRQGLIAVAVMVVAFFFVEQLFEAQIDRAFDQRVFELSAMIDSAAAIANTRSHLRFVVRELSRNSRVKEIVILSAKDGSVLAASRPRGERHRSERDFAERLGRAALASGKFSPDVDSPSGDHYSVLPLTLAAFLLSGDNVLATSHWSAPHWYQALRDRFKNRFSRIPGPLEAFVHDRGENFTVSRDSYSGAIVINSGDNWIVGLIRSANTYMAVMLGLMLAALTVSMVFFFRATVHRPLKAFAYTIERQRATERVVRQPMHGIREFDVVARRWNELVDDKVRTKEALNHSEAHYRRLVDSLPGFAYICDNDERWTMRFLSAAVADITGYRPQDIIADLRVAYADIIHRDDRQRVWKSAQANMAAHRRCEIQYRIVSAEGEVKWVWERGQGVYDAQGRLTGIEGYIEDITALKNHETELTQARLRAEAANRAKSAFIANTNHEMRTPLNAVVGFSELIASERLGPLGVPEYREFAGLIETSARSLLAIINTIMELSRLQSGNAPFEREIIDPVDAIAPLVRAWNSRGQERGIEVSFRNYARGASLLADEAHLFRIVDNLLSNAVKFSPAGGKVHVLVRLREHGSLVVAVRDEGCGIDREHVDEVTQPFFQIDKSFARDHGGIGLGLTLVRECAHLHGASLDIASRPGKGTRVAVTFPPEATVAAAHCRMPAPAHRRPLVARARQA